MNTKEDIWSAIKDLMALQLTTTAVNTWFDDASLLELKDNKAIILSPSDFKRDFIKNRYTNNVLSALHELFGFDFELTVLGESDYASYSRENESVGEAIHEEYTFENYIVGSSNDMAHAAARAVADEPAVNYNPLLLYGGSGLGKTHLLCAIANRIRREQPELKIIYRTGEQFTNEVISAVRSPDPDATVNFRNLYRQADLLLIDDIITTGATAREGARILKKAGAMKVYVLSLAH